MRNATGWLCAVVMLTGALASEAAARLEAIPFAVRAVQLDLARQKETVPFVKGYLRRVSAVGYNTVVL